MLVFNCSKAAAAFFTTTRQKQTVTAIEAAPDKTIEAALARPLAANEVKPWHWLVHAIKAKRKNVLLVMDYHSRFTITLAELKKGDQFAFMRLFEAHLAVHVHQLMAGQSQTTIEASLENYYARYHRCVFHQRGDRSCQSHINDIVWHFKNAVDDIGDVPCELDLIGFDTFANGILRKRKGSNDYFYPECDFLHRWHGDLAGLSEAGADEKVTLWQAKKQQAFKAAVAADMAMAADNVVDLNAFRKK